MSGGIAIPGFEVLAADARWLLRALPIEPGRVRSHRLFTTSAVTVLGMAIDAGALMREHIASVPPLIRVVDGEVQLELRDQQVVLRAGAMVHIDANVHHAVEGLVPTRFLLLLFGGRE